MTRRYDRRPGRPIRSAAASPRRTWGAVAALALAGALGLPGTASAATNLLTNGSFENGLTGWTLSGTETQGYPEVVIPYDSKLGYPNGAFGEAVPAATGSASPDAAGTHGLYFVSDRAKEVVSETIQLAAGTYNVGLSIYAPRNGWNNAGDAFIWATDAGQTLLSTDVHALTPQKWYNVTGTFTASAAGSYTINFGFQTNQVPSADVVIDQLYVVAAAPAETSPVVVSPDEAPLPLLGASPLALAALGGGLFARRRRRAGEAGR